MEQSPDKLWWGPLELTEEKLHGMWEQIKQIPILFDDYSKGNFEDFASKFFHPRNIFIDIGPGLGIAAGFSVRPGLDAVLHLVMFDRKLRGREPLFLEIMQHFFKLLHLRRMTSVIAQDAMVACRLVERLGFKKEGVMRQGLKRDGKYVDVNVYGILKEECDDKALATVR